MKAQTDVAPWLVIVLSWVLSVPSFATAMTWHSGQATLWSNSVISGDLSYNWCVEVVQVRRSDGRISTFSAEQVREFGWFDSELHKFRNFISLTSSINHERGKQSFFEVYMNGPLPVVRRLDQPRSWFSRVGSRPDQYTDNSALAQDTGQFLYFAYDEGQFLAVNHFYTKIYRPKLARYKQELSRFTSVHNLNENTLLGRLMLIDHYNFLSGQDQKTASIKTTSKSSEE